MLQVLLSVSNTFSEKLHREDPKDGTNTLNSLKHPRKSISKHCNASALPAIFSTYGILELHHSKSQPGKTGQHRWCRRGCGCRHTFLLMCLQALWSTANTTLTAQPTRVKRCNRSSRLPRQDCHTNEDYDFVLLNTTSHCSVQFPVHLKKN